MKTGALSKDKQKIEQMFDSIAPRYDFLNHALSLNIDKPWRRKLIRQVKASNPSVVLDLACGTGDVTRGLFEQGISVVGLDLSQGMLDIARAKSDPQINYIKGAADALPFDDESFDAVTIAFGIRNFDNRAKCLQEIKRVLKPGGMLAILEFTIPKNRLWRGIYSFYFRNILPVIGGLISRNKAAYKYLPLSAFDFPQREVFCEELEREIAGAGTGAGKEDGESPTAMGGKGLANATFQSLFGGVACIYIAHAQCVRWTIDAQR